MGGRVYIVRVLMTGRGTSGSFAIRGVQLGQAIGAAVLRDARDISPYDVAVLVKRPTSELLWHIHGARVPLVWDVVDAWPQPHGNDWDRAQCMAWLRETVALIRPAGIVAATEAMADDLGVAGVPVLVLPHHARPGLRRNPIRAELRTVGYEGAPHYIERWRPVIEAECARRGWSFVVNPPELADVDIVLALRDSTGYAPLNWKSNVKLANAQGSGTPVICCREAGYMETQSGAEWWANSPGELIAAFDALTPYDARAAAELRLLAAAPQLSTIAETYRQWLTLNFCAR